MHINTFVNRIIHGDCVQVMRQMPEASVDLVVTDPPYLVNYSDRRGCRVANDNNGSWVEPAFAEVYRLLKPDRLCISFYGWNHTETFMRAWKAAGLTPVGHFVWVKQYASKTGFTEARHEQAYLLAKGHPGEAQSSHLLTCAMTGATPATAYTPPGLTIQTSPRTGVSLVVLDNIASFQLPPCRVLVVVVL